MAAKDYARTSFALPAADLRAMERAADQQHQTLSWLLREAVREWLERKAFPRAAKRRRDGKGAAA